MAKRKVNAAQTMFLVETEYFSGRYSYAVFDARQDARDFRDAQHAKKTKSVYYARVIPAKRGPSNVNR